MVRTLLKKIEVVCLMHWSGEKLNQGAVGKKGY